MRSATTRSATSSRITASMSYLSRKKRACGWLRGKPSMMKPKFQSCSSRRRWTTASTRSSGTSSPAATMRRTCAPSLVWCCTFQRKMSPTLMCSRSSVSASSLACVPFPLPWTPMMMYLRMTPPLHARQAYRAISIPERAGPIQRGARQLLAVEVAEDAASDLAQVGGLGELAGEVVQLRVGQPVQRPGDVGLGRVPQQQHHQLALAGVAAVQPGAGALGGLVVGGWAVVQHRPYLLSCAEAEPLAAVRGHMPDYPVSDDSHLARERAASPNAGAERIKGYPTAEILGEHFSRFYTPEDVAAGKPARALATAVREGRFEARGWRIRKDGSRFYAHVTLNALHDEQGRLTGFAKITQDVTAEREAEQTLRERERQLEQAQSVARLGSFEWDLASDQVSGSPELSRILGLAHAPLATTLDGLLQQVHPDDRQLVAMTVRRAAREGTPFRTRARIIRPTGEVRNVSSWGEVVQDEDGRPSPLLGADFYDALELPDGTVATLIGDVAGHGPDEAAVGVALRAAWRALVLTGHGPIEVLDGLDRVLVSSRPSEETFTTVCCAWVSPDRERVTIALAGHPPPLLVRDGTVQAVPTPGGLALGVDDGVSWQAETLEVGKAWTLLCYTDGLVEGLRAPGSVERFGIEALAETVAGLLEATGGLDELLDRLLEVVHNANGRELSDDVAILCCSRLPRPSAPRPHAAAGAAGPRGGRAAPPGRAGPRRP